jgi:hypothetical protein
MVVNCTTVDSDGEKRITDYYTERKELSYHFPTLSVDCHLVHGTA